MLAWLKRLAVPATGLVAVSLAVLLTLNFFRSSSSPTSGATETSFTDAGAFTYTTTRPARRWFGWIIRRLTNRLFGERVIPLDSIP